MYLSIYTRIHEFAIIGHVCVSAAVCAIMYGGAASPIWCIEISPYLVATGGQRRRYTVAESMKPKTIGHFHHFKLLCIYSDLAGCIIDRCLLRRQIISLRLHKLLCAIRRPVPHIRPSMMQPLFIRRKIHQIRKCEPLISILVEGFDGWRLKINELLIKRQVRAVII